MFNTFTVLVFVVLEATRISTNSTLTSHRPLLKPILQRLQHDPRAQTNNRYYIIITTADHIVASPTTSFSKCTCTIPEICRVWGVGNRHSREGQAAVRDEDDLPPSRERVVITNYYCNVIIFNDVAQPSGTHGGRRTDAHPVQQPTLPVTLIVLINIRIRE